jgi:hypothetical protein
MTTIRFRLYEMHQQLKFQISNTDTKVENLAGAHTTFRFESEPSNFKQILALNNITLSLNQI